MAFRKVQLYIALGGLCLGFSLCGCGDFFEAKPTELEAKALLRDISRVRENPHVGNPLPQVYLEEPKKLKVEDGIKLFYFTKYTPVGDLSFSHKDKNLERSVHGYAGTIRDLGFNVSANLSTNQLIIHCANEAECDAALEYLHKTDVPPIQVHIDCLILERFGDETKDWETSILIEDLFGEGVTLGAAKYPNPAFPGASLRETRRGDFGLDFGFWVNKDNVGERIRGIIDILESRGYLKILMNPTLETVNGKRATVQILDNAPIEMIVTEGNDRSYSVTSYKEVVDTLTVTPYVYADGSIGLNTSIKIGSKSKPEGVIQTPIITERSIDVGENRIQPGKSLVIGGMRKSEDRSVIRGVPFLKDLPIIGVFFSSKDYEQKATEITFILTPSISAGGVEYEDMADVIRKKFATPDYESDIDEIISDPLGADVYSQIVEKQAEKAEAERIRLEVQKVEAEHQARTERLRAEKSIVDTQALHAQMQEAQALIDQAEAQKIAAQAEIEAARKETQAQQAKISMTEAEIQKAQQEAQSAREEAQKAQQTLQQAEENVKRLAEETRKANEEAQNIRRQIEELEKQIEAEKEAQKKAAESQLKETQPQEPGQEPDAPKDNTPPQQEQKTEPETEASQSEQQTAPETETPSS